MQCRSNNRLKGSKFTIATSGANYFSTFKIIMAMNKIKMNIRRNYLIYSYNNLAK